MARSKTPKPRKEPKPTGVDSIDRLASLDVCELDDYLRAVSEYVRRSSELDDGPKKAGQIRLSHGLARVLASELQTRLPKLKEIHVGERKVSGALRTVNADVSEIHGIDGLRLAVEIKPVNLAVGRAIWNRFGDVRTFAVNLHLKFPFCVVGGVLVIPTYEEIGTRAANKASEEESEIAADEEVAAEQSSSPKPATRSTRHLIEKAVQRFMRAGGRKTEADGAHLLEGIGVIVYDPATGMLDESLPPIGSGLRWDEFMDSLVSSYDARFE